jgi:hypothetical protein
MFLNYFFDFINEGLIKSYDIEKSKNIIERFLQKEIDDFDIVISDFYSYDKMIIIIVSNKKIFNDVILKKFKKLLKTLGYYIDNINCIDGDFNLNDIKKYNCDEYRIYLQRYFDKKINNLKSLYHITTEDNCMNILKNGLKPKNNFPLGYYPDRIYLFTKLNYDKIHDLLSIKFNPLDLTNMVFCILKVDVSKLNINLYVDSYYKDNLAVYTYDNISPYLIELYEKFDFSEKFLFNW